MNNDNPIHAHDCDAAFDITLNNFSQMIASCREADVLPDEFSYAASIYFANIVLEMGASSHEAKQALLESIDLQLDFLSFWENQNTPSSDRGALQ